MVLRSTAECSVLFCDVIFVTIMIVTAVASESDVNVKVCDSAMCSDSCSSVRVAHGDCRGSASSGVAFHCNKSTALCVRQLDFGSNASCGNSPVSRASIVCDLCTRSSSAASVSDDANFSFAVLRNCLGPTPELFSECDASCASCRRQQQLALNTCLHDDGDNHNFVTYELPRPCGNLVVANMFESDICEGTPNMTVIDADECISSGNLSVEYECIFREGDGGTMATWRFDTLTRYEIETNESTDSSAFIDEALMTLESVAQFLNLSQHNTGPASARRQGSRPCDYTAAFVLPNNTLVAPLNASGMLPTGLLSGDGRGFPFRSVSFAAASRGFLNLTFVSSPNPGKATAVVRWSFALVCADLSASRTLLPSPADFTPAFSVERYLNDVAAAAFAHRWANRDGPADETALFRQFLINKLTSKVFYPLNVTRGPHRGASHDALLGPTGIAGSVLSGIGGLVFVWLVIYRFSTASHKRRRAARAAACESEGSSLL